MSTAAIPLSETSRRLLSELAAQTGQTQAAILDQALDAYRRQLFFEGLNADFAALKAAPEAWAEELAERQLWETTLTDGLDPEERWSEDGRCLNPPAGDAP